MSNDKQTLMSAVDNLCRNHKNDPNCFSSHDLRDLHALVQSTNWLLGEAYRSQMTEERYGQKIRGVHALCGKLEKKWRDYQYESKYSPDQPRVPAGNSDGGQWTDAGGGSGGAGGFGAGRSAGDILNERLRNPQPLTPISTVASNSRDVPLPSSRPEYSRDNSPVSHDDWNTIKDVMGSRPDLSDTKIRAYSTTWALEGGLTSNLTNDATGGITPETLDWLKTQSDLADQLEDINTPSDLQHDPDLMPDVYNAVFDRDLSRVGGSDALDRVGNPYAAAAMADTVFREGRMGGAQILADAIKETAPKLGSNLPATAEITSIGPPIFDKYSTLAKNPATLGPLLDNVAKERIKYRPKETVRPNYFRFEKERKK
jgi:hypothetical protein